MDYFDLLEDVAGESYEAFIEFLCEHSDKFYFITRKELDFPKEALQKFKPYIIKQYKTKEWESTITAGPAATLYEIEINHQTIDLLKSSANKLYDWVQPELPEDLSFLKNGFPWFYTCSHEEFAHFQIRSDFYRNLILANEHIKVQQIKE